MKFISLFLVFYAFSSFAFISPNQSGIPNQMLCALAIQAGVSGERSRSDDELCFSVEDCKTMIEDIEEEIEDLEKDFKDIKKEYEDYFNTGFTCNSESLSVEDTIIPEMIDYVSGGQKPTEGTDFDEDECSINVTENNGAYNLKNPFLYSQLLKIPFLIFAPSYARADEDDEDDYRIEEGQHVMIVEENQLVIKKREDGSLKTIKTFPFVLYQNLGNIVKEHREQTPPISNLGLYTKIKDGNWSLGEDKWNGENAQIPQAFAIKGGSVIGLTRISPGGTVQETVLGDGSGLSNADETQDIKEVPFDAPKVTLPEVEKVEKVEDVRRSSSPFNPEALQGEQVAALETVGGGGLPGQQAGTSRGRTPAADNIEVILGDGHNIGTTEDLRELGAGEECQACVYQRYFNDHEIDDEICEQRKGIIFKNNHEDECEDFISGINNIGDKLREMEDLKREVETQRRKLRDLNRTCRYKPNRPECKSSNTESGGFCIECFNSVIEAGQPKRSIFDRVLSGVVPAAALYLGYKGISESNDQAVRSGYEPNNSAYASLAFPFIQHALYGGNRGLGPCSGSATGSLYGNFNAGGLFNGFGGNGFGYGGGGGLNLNALFNTGGGFNGFGPGFGSGGGGGGLNLNALLNTGGGFNGFVPGGGGGFNLNGRLNIGGGFNGFVPGGGGLNLNALLNTGGGFNGLGYGGGGGLAGLGGLGGLGGGLSQYDQYSAQLEAQANYQRAYMERLQVAQQRQLAQSSALQSVNEELVQLLNQRSRILGGSR